MKKEKKGHQVQLRIITTMASKAVGKGSRAWLMYLLVGVLATGGYFFLPSSSIQNIFYNLIGYSAVVAIIVGVWMHHPVHPLRWYVFAFGLLMFVVGDTIWTYYENVSHIERPFPSVADTLYLLGYPVIAAGLVFVYRRRIAGHQWADLVDALIIATVAGMFSWIFLMEPKAYNQTHSLLGRLISIAYPLADLVLLVALLRLLLASEKRQLTHYLLSLSLIFLLVADTAFAAALLVGHYKTGTLIDAGWLFSYVLFGAAALHPSMVRLSEPISAPRAHLTWQRLVLLTGTSMTAPILLAYQAAFDEEIDVPVIVGGSVVLFLLVALRMAGMIKESKRAEKETKESNRRLEELAVLKADFTAMVAHELGGPLAAMRRLAEMLSAGGSEPHIREYATAAIEGELDALDNLVSDVRASAEVERDDFRVQLRAVALSELLTDAEIFAHTLPNGRPVELILDPRLGAHERVLADPERIGQVLRNLLSNAAKYSSQGVLIELRAKQRGQERVRIEVADHGPGIRPEDQTRIFEKFGRGRDREGKKISGVGLGLYVSRGIVRAHGSELTVYSAPGEGAVFGFDLRMVR